MSTSDMRRTPQEWAKQKATSAFTLAIAQRIERWPLGRLITEADFDRAISRASSVRFQ